jgi:hypothetical protein
MSLPLQKEAMLTALDPRAMAQKYTPPPGLMQMVTGMRTSGQGVVVLSCSDPRLNPYQILGIDATLSTFFSVVGCDHQERG